MKTRRWSAVALAALVLASVGAWRWSSVSTPANEVPATSTAGAPQAPPRE